MWCPRAVHDAQCILPHVRCCIRHVKFTLKNKVASVDILNSFNHKKAYYVMEHMYMCGVISEWDHVPCVISAIWGNARSNEVWANFATLQDGDLFRYRGDPKPNCLQLKPGGRCIKIVRKCGRNGVVGQREGKQKQHGCYFRTCGKGGTKVLHKRGGVQ